MLSKICSDLHKPDGQFMLERDRKSVIDFIDTLPIRKVDSEPWFSPVSDFFSTELSFQWVPEYLGTE